MSRDFFQFKQFRVFHDKSSMKVGTDAVLLPCLTDFTGINTILEIGCGSGVISLICAQKTNAEIVAIDIHSDSVDQANENFSISSWNSRLNAHHISLQELAANTTEKFDLIISNPPFFIDSMKSASDNRNLARHNDNLSQEEILKSARQLLKPKGSLSLILPLTEGEELITKSLQEGFYLKSRVDIRPKPSREINRIVIELCLTKHEKQFNDLIIREESNQYTFDYKELTKDFYLAL